MNKKWIYIIAGTVLGLIISTYKAAADPLDDGYAYQGLAQMPSNPLPSEQSMADIQQMSGDRDLRDAPGGPGLGEIPICLDFGASNIFALAVSCATIIAVRKHRKKK
jgi:hypothetical protein